jgi:hypothetical protein
MEEGPDKKITVASEAPERRRYEATVEILVDQTPMIVAMLAKEYPLNSAEAVKIHMPFYKNGEITEEARGLIIEAMKKYQHLIVITPEVMQKMSEIVMGYMGKMGYDISKVRQRILSLEKRPRDL